MHSDWIIVFKHSRFRFQLSRCIHFVKDVEGSLLWRQNVIIILQIESSSHGLLIQIINIDKRRLVGGSHIGRVHSLNRWWNYEFHVGDFEVRDIGVMRVLCVQILSYLIPVFLSLLFLIPRGNFMCLIHNMECLRFSPGEVFFVLLSDLCYRFIILLCNFGSIPLTLGTSSPRDVQCTFCHLL